MLINSQIYLPIFTITPFKLGILGIMGLIVFWSQTRFPKFTWHNLIKGLFVFYLLCVAQLTTSINIYTPWTYWHLIRGAGGFGYLTNIEWHPLEMYKTIYTSASQYTIAGNLIMLLPLTIFISLLWPHLASWKKMLKISFFTSLTIETSQLIFSYFYLEHRLFDLNDLLQNTLGGLAGFGIFLIIRKLSTSVSYQGRHRLKNN
jgi:glycopeptide antibiotics resistance protein